MYLKEFAIIALAALLVIIATGTVAGFHLSAYNEAQKLYLTASLPAVWKKFSEIDIPFDVSRTFEYALFEVISEGGIMEPSEFVEKIYTKFSQHIKEFPYLYGHEFSFEPEPSKFASSQSSEMKARVKVTISGGDITSVKLVEENPSTPVRAGLLYEKAYMFYRFALNSEPIACFSWDGNNKLVITLHTLKGEPAKVHVHVNSTQASIKSYHCKPGTVYEKHENKLYEVLESPLSNKETCKIEIELKGNKAIIYRALISKDEDCTELSCDDFIPTLIKKGEPYEVCINTRENIIEHAKKEVEEKCYGDNSCLPAEVQDEYDGCDEDECKKHSPKWALAKATGCASGCSDENLEACIKNRLKNFLQEIMDDIANNENDENTEWEIKVDVNTFDFSYDGGYCCWEKKCEYKCHCESVGNGNGNSGSSSVSTSRAIGVTRYFFAKYTEKDLVWPFTYSYSDEVGETQKYTVTCPSNYQCPPCTLQCGEGEKLVYVCDTEISCRWHYSYKYSYTYTLTIKIKDKKRKIILAE